MNKTLQTEHTLKHIEGNTIVASKKKRVTSSGETGSNEMYTKPSSFMPVV